jgi:hypothetical protein
LPTEVTRRHLEEQQVAMRKRRGSGRAASYKPANQASSAGVWRRESAKRRAHTSFMPYAMPAACACALSLARPAALPAWVMQPVATALLSLCLCYVPSPPSPPLGSWARPCCTGCSPEKAPAPNGGRFQFSVQLPVQLPVQPPDRPKKCHHRIPCVLGWANFSVVVKANP